MTSDQEPWARKKHYRQAITKNAMYDQYLRNTTNRLQDDLRSTMKTYKYEKERLAHQLSHLQSTDRSPTNTSMDSFGDQSSNGLSRRSQYFRAPNFAASSTTSSFLSGSSGNKREHELHLPPTDKKWKEKRDADKIKKEREMLKLPVIHSANSNRSEWESGKFLSAKQDTLSGMEPLPGITAAKALLSESMKIPSIYDPNRSDTAIDTVKTKSNRKKVTFADMSQSQSSNFRETKNLEKKGLMPKLKLTPNQFSHVSRPARPKKTSLLPPIDISQVRRNPQKVTDGLNEWKSLYSNIVDPEERTRALTDILHAVRLKKYENEQAIKFGNSPRPEDKDEMLKEFLQMTSGDRLTFRDEHGNKRPGLAPSPRNTAARLGRRSHSYQLQSYLRQMSRSRRMIEHMQAEEYRLAHISGHRSLQEALKQNPTPVEANG